MTVRTPAQTMMVEEAREALRQHAAGNVSGYELHRANVRRIQAAVAQWVETGDHWAGRFAPTEVRDMGGGRAYYRRCLVCSGHAMLGSESAHARWCDAEQLKVADAQAAEIQQLRIRGLL